MEGAKERRERGLALTTDIAYHTSPSFSMISFRAFRVRWSELSRDRADAARKAFNATQLRRPPRLDIAMPPKKGGKKGKKDEDDDAYWSVSFAVSDRLHELRASSTSSGRRKLLLPLPPPRRQRRPLQPKSQKMRLLPQLPRPRASQLS